MDTKITHRQLYIDLERAGATMANIFYNLAQKTPGRALTADDMAMFDDARRAWDLACGRMQQAGHLTGIPIGEDTGLPLYRPASLKPVGVEPVKCGACHGSGWVPRDPDIGTEQECFSCDGSGVDEEETASRPSLAPVVQSQWISVDERLPEVDVLVLVYAPPQAGDHPNDVRISFDCIDPNDDDHASWLNHNEHYEHFCCVAKPEGSTGPSEKAPYTHWAQIPAPPTHAPGKQEGEKE